MVRIVAYRIIDRNRSGDYKVVPENGRPTITLAGTRKLNLRIGGTMVHEVDSGTFADSDSGEIVYNLRIKGIPIAPSQETVIPEPKKPTDLGYGNIASLLAGVNISNVSGWIFFDPTDEYNHSIAIAKTRDRVEDIGNYICRVGKGGVPQSFDCIRRGGYLGRVYDTNQNLGVAIKVPLKENGNLIIPAENLASRSAIGFTVVRRKTLEMFIESVARLEQ